MPVIFPYIPRTITVHMGPPNQWAENVTVTFPDYVKNVASSEIYPTWEPAAIRANVLAIISFALNRVYTEFYPSRGYDFQITASTAYDQKFIRDREIFENISQIVDDIFDNYIRRQGVIEPLAAKFCNGTTTTCAGLSQWGSQALAEQGYNSLEILRNYYGNDIELVVDAPVQDVVATYPEVPLRLGALGDQVAVVQTMLNRISRNYPAIPKIAPVTGVFGESTEAAVRQFQSIFNLTPDGIVGKATWYQMVNLYVAVQRLSELVSQEQTIYRIQPEFPGVLREGDEGDAVRTVQYMLALLAEFNDALAQINIDGVFGPQTTQAVRQFQSQVGLTPDGVVWQMTWRELYRRASEVYFSLSRDTIRAIGERDESVFAMAEQTQRQRVGDVTRMGQNPGYDVALGQNDRNERQEGVQV